MILVELWCTDERRDKDDEEERLSDKVVSWLFSKLDDVQYSQRKTLTQEDELSPEVECAKVRIVDINSVQEGTGEARRADVGRRMKVGHFRAGPNQLGMVSAVRLSPWLSWRVGAERLRSEMRVLRRDHGDEREVDGERYHDEQDDGHQHRLRRGVALADLEETKPQEADAHDPDADNGAEEEEQHQQRDEHVIDRKYLGGQNKEPIGRVEDVDVTQDVPAFGLADRVLGLVDSGQEHRYPDEERDDEEQNPSEEFERPEDGLSLRPGFYQPALAVAPCFVRQPFATDQCSFFSQQSI